MKFKAQGFHSLNPTTKWDVVMCAGAEKCNLLHNGNGYCKTVIIRAADGYEIKDSGSSMWPTLYTPAQLVPFFQYLYNSCQPAASDGALCYPDCHWKGNANGFDIVIATEGGAIVTAYPAQGGTCNKHNEWQDCDSMHCQGLQL